MVLVTGVRQSLQGVSTFAGHLRAMTWDAWPETRHTALIRFAPGSRDLESETVNPIVFVTELRSLVRQTCPSNLLARLVQVLQHQGHLGQPQC